MHNITALFVVLMIVALELVVPCFAIMSKM